MKKKKSELKWNVLDRIIAKFRYSQVDKYILKNGTIVDIGCGQEGSFLLRHKDNINVGYGFDFKIQNHMLDNISFINNSKLKELPLNENSIDIIFLNAVLEHLENPKQVLLDSLKVLKEKGKIVMTTPTSLSKPLLEFLAFKLHIINEMEIKEHVHYYSLDDINNLIKFLNGYYDVKLLKYKKFELGLNSLIVLKKN